MVLEEIKRRLMTFVRKYPYLDLEEDLENQIIEEIRVNFDEANERTTSFTRMCVRDIVDLVDAAREMEQRAIVKEKLK